MEKAPKIPFVPFPVRQALKMSKPLLWPASQLIKTNPFLGRSLLEAGIKIKDREYMAMAMFSALFWFLIIFTTFSCMSAIFHKDIMTLTLGFSSIISIMALSYILFYPNLSISKKNVDVDKNILFAIRHMFIQVKSGVSLFDSMVSVSRGNYGVVSDEFNTCTKEIATGTEESVSLENLAFRTPNQSLKRVIWQVVNSMKAGGDIGNTLSQMASHLSEEQKVKIRQYGSTLSPMALMYLMLTVILPTLGVTFMVIFSTFSGIQIPETIFYLLLAVLGVFQFMFVGLIKSRRPSVEI
jgi:archaeal flagellar protein FlaJ